MLIHEQVEVMSLLRRHFIARNGRNNVATHLAKCYRCLIYNRYNSNNCMIKIDFVVAQFFRHTANSEYHCVMSDDQMTRFILALKVIPLDRLQRIICSVILKTWL